MCHGIDARPSGRNRHQQRRGHWRFVVDRTVRMPTPNALLLRIMPLMFIARGDRGYDCRGPRSRRSAPGWSDEDPHEIVCELCVQSDYYNCHEHTVGDFCQLVPAVPQWREGAAAFHHRLGDDIFDVRIPGLRLIVVVADGQPAHPVTIGEYACRRWPLGGGRPRPVPGNPQCRGQQKSPDSHQGFGTRRLGSSWRPHGDSNPGRYRERVMS